MVLCKNCSCHSVSISARAEQQYICHAIMVLKLISTLSCTWCISQQPPVVLTSPVASRSAVSSISGATFLERPLGRPLAASKCPDIAQIASWCCERDVLYVSHRVRCSQITDRVENSVNSAARGPHPQRCPGRWLCTCSLPGVQRCNRAISLHLCSTAGPRQSETTTTIPRCWHLIAIHNTQHYPQGKAASQAQPLWSHWLSCSSLPCCNELVESKHSRISCQSSCIDLAKQLQSLQTPHTAAASTCQSATRSLVIADELLLSRATSCTSLMSISGLELSRALQDVTASGHVTSHHLLGCHQSCGQFHAAQADRVPGACGLLLCRTVPL